jgi:TRAP-type C4-dicarboxylate transport system permease large subunit
MAANLYVAARTIGSDLLCLLKHSGWFLFAALVVLAAITYVPQLSLWYRYFF